MNMATVLPQTLNILLLSHKQLKASKEHQYFLQTVNIFCDSFQICVQGLVAFFCKNSKFVAISRWAKHFSEIYVEAL